MIERIARLVTNHKIAPESILGVTFTRNAAEEMRNRLKPVLGDLADRVMLSTVHSFCFWVLKNEGYVFEILYGKEQIIFMREVIKKLRFRELPPAMVLREISLSKNNLISAEDMKILYEGDKTMLKVADVYQRYDEEKRKKMLLDFDDLLVETYTLLEQDEQVKSKYRLMFRHLLVDEIQDISAAQFEILKLLIDGDSQDASFWVCGDDWQSIYSFIGATLGNILNFKEMFPQSKEYILNLNYRSTPQIIKACQQLIQHNVRKIEKALQAHNEDGEEVVLLESSSEEGEALSIVNEIMDLVHRRGFAHNQISILYRANFQSRVVEEVFSQHHIPYHIENGLNFYSRSEVKILLDYLRLINDPNSDAGDEALLSVINVPNRYIGRTFTSELQAFAARREQHLYPALKSIIIDLPYVRKNVNTFIEFLEPLMADAESLEPAELIGLLRSSLDYDRHVTDSDIPSPDDSKIQNLNELQLAATRYSKIQQFLDYADTFQDSLVHDPNGVSLMTIHKAKGLEFPAVFVIGLVEGIMPTKKGDIEEERRICFVGISRAMKLLYLSWSQTYLGQASKKSTFIDEMLGTQEST
jgi:DNA helicase-2/ATP-dependent DNA helicase PcrA